MGFVKFVQGIGIYHWPSHQGFQEIYQELDDRIPQPVTWTILSYNTLVDLYGHPMFLHDVLPLNNHSTMID